MGQHIHARVGGDGGGDAADQAGIQDRHVGSSLSWTSGYLMWVALSVITAKLVASLPVPLVVGTATHRGF